MYSDEDAQSSGRSEHQALLNGEEPVKLRFDLNKTGRYTLQRFENAISFLNPFILLQLVTVV